MKLFSTSRRLIPIKLKIIIEPVIKKIIFELVWALFAKNEVITDTSFLFKEIFSSGTKVISDGRSVNVIKNETTSPTK